MTTKINSLIALAGDNSPIDSPPSASFDPVRWAQQNPWLVEGQANDRKPMITSGTRSSGSASAQRSATRRAHQIEFKAWSKERHD